MFTKMILLQMCVPAQERVYLGCSSVSFAHLDQMIDFWQKVQFVVRLYEKVPKFSASTNPSVWCFSSGPSAVFGSQKEETASNVLSLISSV